ncbi:MAG: phosphatase PAP2 family protein [Vicinamibacteraceae bacterium]
MPKLAAVSVALVLLSTPAFSQSLGPVSGPLTDAPAAEPPAPSFGSLFRSLAGDFGRLPSLETALVLGTAGGISLAAQRNDALLTRRAVASETLDLVFEPGDVVGGGLSQVGGALATYLVGRATGHPRVAVLGGDLLRAQMVNSVLTQGIKLAVDRPRPDLGRYSFPSGHASATFATAAVLQRHYGWKAGVPAYGLAAFVAGSRIQENRHFLSDVVFGAAIGVVSGRAVSVGHGRGRFAVAPIGVPGGGGIGFTLAGRQ